MILNTVQGMEIAQTLRLRSSKEIVLSWLCPLHINPSTFNFTFNIHDLFHFIVSHGYPLLFCSSGLVLGICASLLLRS